MCRLEGVLHQLGALVGAMDAVGPTEVAGLVLVLVPREVGGGQMVVINDIGGRYGQRNGGRSG